MGTEEKGEEEVSCARCVEWDRDHTLDCLGRRIYWHGVGALGASVGLAS